MNNTRAVFKTKSAINTPMLVHFAVSFLLGRVFLAECISPFASAYFCSYLKTNNKSTLKTVLTAVISIVGVLTTSHRNMVLRYALAFVLFGIVHISATTFGKEGGEVKLYSSVAAANFLSGLIYYAQIEGFWHNLLMLAIESVACFVIPFAIRSSAEIVCGEKPVSDITGEDTAAIYIILCAVVTGFCGMSVGNIALFKTMSALFIMIIAFAGGCGASTTCGVGIGVLNSLFAFELNECAGVFGFCGLCAGLMSKKKRAGVILGFVVSSKFLSMYFGGWSDSVFSDFETIIAVCLFCLIPYSVLMKAKTFINAGAYKSEELGQKIDNVSKKLREISDTFTALADMSKAQVSKTPINHADISIFYDMAADKVCKNCGLKFICWNKEAHDTRDLINKMMPALKNNGYITLEDIPDRFRQKCIKSTIFVNELNRIYSRLNIDRSKSEHINQGQRLISMQLNGMSEIVDNLTSGIDKSIIFDKSNENDIYCRLEQEGVSCSDINVVKDENNITRVTMRVKQNSANFTSTSALIETAVSKTLGKSMGIESYTCKKNKFFITLSEREQFDIIYSYKSIPKSGETVCGDNVAFGKISGSKQAFILSDGMGSGEQASKMSKGAIELLQKFLNAGFDKEASVNMIGASLMLGGKEMFTTIDAVIIDLLSAEVEFVKAGANTSYVKTKNKVRKLSSTSLPVGIIENTEIDTSTYRANDGDIIVMISDGIQSAADDWFEEYLLNIHEENPDIICSLLLDEALRNRKQNDDMTIVVIKITKR